MISRNIFMLSAVTRSFALVARTLSLSSGVRVRRRPRTVEPRLAGSAADNMFAQDEMDNLEALEDFINEGGTEGHGRHLEERTELLIKRQLEQQKKTLKKTILEKKFFKQPQEVNLLTWNAKQQIKYLNTEFPEEWTPERLAESFPISHEGVQKLLRTSYKPRSEEEIMKHDKRVAAHWRKLKQTLAIEGGPAESQTNHFQHITDTGKLPLMINAAGSSQLPVPRTPRGMLLQGERKMGVFESIVAGSDFVKAYEEKLVKSKAHQQADGQKLLRDIADSGQKQRNRTLKTGFIEGGGRNTEK